MENIEEYDELKKVPSSIGKKVIGSLESIKKYLKDNTEKDLSFVEADEHTVFIIEDGRKDLVGLPDSIERAAPVQMNDAGFFEEGKTARDNSYTRFMGMDQNNSGNMYR